MLHEQGLAATAEVGAEDTTVADADAFAAVSELQAAGPSDTADLVEQMEAVHSSVNLADAMELCSTAELVDLFAEYYEADVEQLKTNYFISDHSINAEIDFDHIAFNTPGVTSKAPLARAVLCSSTQRLDIDSSISHDCTTLL